MSTVMSMQPVRHGLGNFLTLWRNTWCSSNMATEFISASSLFKFDQALVPSQYLLRGVFVIGIRRMSSVCVGHGCLPAWARNGRCYWCYLNVDKYSTLIAKQRADVPTFVRQVSRLNLWAPVCTSTLMPCCEIEFGPNARLNWVTTKAHIGPERRG